MSLLTKEERKSLERTERRALRKERRKERRLEGNAPDQKVGRFLSGVFDEDKARAFLMDTVADLAEDIRDGDIDIEEAIEEILDELQEEADDLLDFSGIPMVGPLLEMVDGPLFDLLFRDALRPWVKKQLDVKRD